MDTFIEVLCWMVYAAGVEAYGEDLRFWIAQASDTKPWSSL